MRSHSGYEEIPDGPDSDLESQTNTPRESAWKKAGKFILCDILAINPDERWPMTFCQLGFSLWATKSAYEEVDDLAADHLPPDVIKALGSIVGVIVFFATQHLSSSIALSISNRRLEQHIDEVTQELEKIKQELKTVTQELEATQTQRALMRGINGG